MTADQWDESGERLPDGRPRVLRFIPTDEEKTSVLKGFLRLNISKGERKTGEETAE